MEQLKAQPTACQNPSAALKTEFGPARALFSDMLPSAELGVDEMLAFSEVEGDEECVRSMGLVVLRRLFP